MHQNELNPYAAPTRTPNASVVTGPPVDCWADGELLVVTRTSHLPCQCTHCDIEADDDVGITGFFPDPDRAGPNRLLLPISLAASIVFGVGIHPLLDIMGIGLMTAEVVTICVLLSLATVLLLRIRGEKSGAELRLPLCSKHRRWFVINKTWARLCASLPFGLIATVTLQRMQIVSGLAIQYFFALMFVCGIAWFGIAKVAFVPQLQHRMEGYVWLSGCNADFLGRLKQFRHSPTARASHPRKLSKAENP